ncbi:MAG TPA: response regulator, partial [Polyangiaceae bacterium]|nr:response regulator [Polyangiaceae bacterium]
MPYHRRVDALSDAHGATAQMNGSWTERLMGGVSTAIERTLPDSIRAAPPGVRRRAVLCVLLPLAVSLITAVTAVVLVVLERPLLRVAITTVGVFAALATSQVVRITRSVRAAGHLFSLLSFLFMSTSTVIAGGLASPRAFSLMLIPMMASLLLEWRDALIWLAAVTLELLLLIIFTFVGPDLSPGADPATLRIFGLGAIIILVFSMLVIAAYDHANAVVTEELAQALKKAAAVNDLKSALVANVSHELRTPLNGVLGSADLLMRSGLDEAQRVHAETIETASEALLRLIDDLLDMSRLEAGGMELDEVPIELRQVLGQTVEALAPLAEAREGARMVLHVEPDVPDEVIADPFRLRQIFTNLLSNAIKFTDDGHVVLRVETVDGACRFCVSDTGVGIPEEDHERLFAAFEQARPSTAQFHGGSGLGLNIARRLVHLMGGDIAVRSAVGSGTTFCFDLPLREAPEDSTPRVKTDRLQVAVDLRDAREEAAVRAALQWLGHERVRSAPEADIVIHDAAQPLGEWSVRIVMPSEIGRRTRREVRLARPFSPDRLGAALHRAVNEVSSSRPPTSSIAGKGRVLVADDNLVNRRVVHGQLSHLGFEPVVVSSGTAALEAVTGASTPFLGVFLDLRMPGMNGYETAVAIRAWEKKEHL